MRLEHINLVVRDIPETLHFYQAAFPTWKVRSHGEGEWSGEKRNWLHFGDDYQYLALNDDGVGENRDLAGHQTGLAHFAYTTDDIQSVIDRLEAAGYPQLKPGPDNPFRRNAYFIDPNGFEIEFVQYFSDKPEERNNELS